MHARVVFGAFVLVSCGSATGTPSVPVSEQVQRGTEITAADANRVLAALDALLDVELCEADVCVRPFPIASITAIVPDGERVHAIGPGNAYSEWRDGAWHISRFPTATPMYGLTVMPDHALIAVGGDRTILRRGPDDAEWQVLHQETRNECGVESGEHCTESSLDCLLDVAAGSNGELWIAGRDAKYRWRANMLETFVREGERESEGALRVFALAEGTAFVHPWQASLLRADGEWQRFVDLQQCAALIDATGCGPEMFFDDDADGQTGEDGEGNENDGEGPENVESGEQKEDTGTTRTEESGRSVSGDDEEDLFLRACTVAGVVTAEQLVLPSSPRSPREYLALASERTMRVESHIDAAPATIVDAALGEHNERVFLGLANGHWLLVRPDAATGESAFLPVTALDEGAGYNHRTALSLREDFVWAIIDQHLLRVHGNTVLEIALGAGEWTDLQALPSGRAVAVNADGAIEFFGARGLESHEHVQARLRTVAGSDETHLWVGGDNGRLFSRQASALWSRVETGVSVAIHAISVGGDIVGGDFGTVLARRNDSFVRLPRVTENAVFAITTDGGSILARTRLVLEYPPTARLNVIEYRPDAHGGWSAHGRGTASPVLAHNAHHALMTFGFDFLEPVLLAIASTDAAASVAMPTISRAALDEAGAVLPFPALELGLPLSMPRSIAALPAFASHRMHELELNPTTTCCDSEGDDYDSDTDAIDENYCVRPGSQCALHAVAVVGASVGSANDPRSLRVLAIEPRANMFVATVRSADGTLVSESPAVAQGAIEPLLAFVQRQRPRFPAPSEWLESPSPSRDAPFLPSYVLQRTASEDRVLWLLGDNRTTTTVSVAPRRTTATGTTGVFALRFATLGRYWIGVAHDGENPIFVRINRVTSNSAEAPENDGRQSAPVPCRVFDPDGATNLRTRPSAASPVISVVANGTLAAALERRGHWLRLAPPNDGWVFDANMQCTEVGH